MRFKVGQRVFFNPYYTEEIVGIGITCGHREIYNVIYMSPDATDEVNISTEGGLSWYARDLYLLPVEEILLEIGEDE